MNNENVGRRVYLPVRRERSTHLYAVGQVVRLKGEILQRLDPDSTYRITATLPPIGQMPQYRIRSESEHHERVAMQDSLDLVAAGSDAAAPAQGIHGLA